MSTSQQPLLATIIVMSDRAYKKVYKDESGPLLEQMLKSYLAEKRVSIQSKVLILPDEAEMLKTELQNRIDKSNLIFISGGTGIGPRDNTPEVVKPLLTKEIPGIMEMIRVKYGMQFPNALLSRGVAGVAGETLLYAMPGNPRAVKDYMQEILPTLLHSLKMLQGEGH